MAQLKGKKLMIVTLTPDGFRAAVSALRSLDGKDLVSFHPFTLPEDRCAPLLVKNLGMGVPGQAFRLANYVCHRTDRPTAGGGTAMLVRRGIVHYTMPVPGLTHLEATVIQVTLAGKPVLILAA